MARGLAAAHAQGIVHRDVKPGNVFVGTDGQVKLLDFGIAKLAAGSSGAAGPRGLLDATLTTPGGTHVTDTVLGTPAYMSPEQVRGEPLDARSDIFSLGAVLHELFGGGLAFPGSSPVDASYAILNHDPSPLPPEVPRAVTQVVVRCLEKEPGRRFQSASDLAFALDVLEPDSGALPTVTEPRRALRGRWWAIAMLGLVVVATGMALTHRWSTTTPPPTIERITHRWGAVHAARFVPDGRVVFSAAFEGGPEEIYSQTSGRSMAQSLGLVNASLASVSRTGELAVLMNPIEIPVHTGHGTLARVPGMGGTPREVAENVEYADWSNRGELAVVVSEKESRRTLEYPPGKPLFQTSGWISCPRFSRAGDRIAFLHHPLRGDDMGEVMVMDLEGQTKVLTKPLPASTGLAWGPDDQEIWFSWGEFTTFDTIGAVDLQGRTREVYRAPSALKLADVASDGSVLLTSEFWRAELVHIDSGGGQQLLSWTDVTFAVASLSRDGKALFTSYDWRPASDERVPFVMLRQADGRRPPQALGEGIALDLSADGRWALMQTLDGRTLTAIPTGPGHPRRFDLGPLEMSVFGARWLPDGQRVVVMARPSSSSSPRLFLLSTDGNGPRQLSDAALFTSLKLQPLFVSPDGQWAATFDADDRPVRISLGAGTVQPIPGLKPGETIRGWTDDGQLWFTRDSGRPPARTTLFRLELATGRVLGSRTIAAAELTGSGSILQLVISPDGREVAFTFFRQPGYLYILRGLPAHP